MCIIDNNINGNEKLRASQNKIFEVQPKTNKLFLFN